MKTCSMHGCGGDIDENVFVWLRNGCSSVIRAYPCKKCNRLHFACGALVFSRRGDPVYLGRNVCQTLEDTHLLVFRFPTEQSRDRRDKRNMKFVSSITNLQDFSAIAGPWLLCWNPRTEKWVPEEQLAKAFYGPNC